MSRTIRNTPVSVRTGATRRFRKALSRMARDGAYKPKLVGSRTNGFAVAVVRGRKAVVTSPVFPFKGQAEAWSVQKYGVAPPTRPMPFPVS